VIGSMRKSGLRRRTFLIGSLSWISFVLLLALVSSTLLDRGFHEVESREFTEMQARVRDVVHRRILQVDWKGRDWAEWTSADNWLRTGGTTFTTENLNDSSLAILDEAYLAYFHTDKRAAAVLGFDRSSRHSTIPDTNCLRQAIPDSGSGRLIGLFRCGDSLQITSVWPVRNSMGSGDPSGWFVVGHKVDGQEEKELEALLGQDIQIQSRMNDSASVRVQDSFAIVQVPYPVVHDRVPAGIEFAMARPVHDVSMRIRKLMIWALVTMAFVGTILALFILEIFVVRRIVRLSRDVVAHGEETGMPATSFGDQGPDEIGALGTAIDELVSRLVGAQERLASALEEAQAGTRAKSAFLASISHDLRTPLNGMIGLTDFLLKTKLDESQNEAMELLRSASENLLAMINDILEFSRREAGHAELQPEDVGTEDVFHQPIRVLAPIAHRQGIDLTLVLDPDLPSKLFVDASRIRQILHNLVGNALKFTEKGEVNVFVRCTAKVDDKIRLRVSVCDTGAGIPVENLQSIFQPFVQVSTEIGKRQGGTGLGLPIARQMVEQMGGSLGVRSVVGDGSEFFFEIEIPVSDGAKRLVPLNFPWTPLGPVAVLVQRASLRASLLELLARIELDPVEILAPEVVHELAEAGPLGLLIVDVESMGLGELPGLARLRADPALADVPVILLSRTDRFGDDGICRIHGVRTVLNCPVPPSQILDALERELRPSLRIGAMVSNPFLWTMVEGMLRSRGHQVVQTEGLDHDCGGEEPQVWLLDGDAPAFAEQWSEVSARCPGCVRIQLGGFPISPSALRLERPFSLESLCELVEGSMVHHKNRKSFS